MKALNLSLRTASFGCRSSARTRRTKPGFGPHKICHAQKRISAAIFLCCAVQLIRNCMSKNWTHSISYLINFKMRPFSSKSTLYNRSCNIKREQNFFPKKLSPFFACIEFGHFRGGPNESNIEDHVDFFALKS